MNTEVDDIQSEVCSNLSYTPPKEELREHIKHYSELGMDSEDIVTALTFAYKVRGPYLDKLQEFEVLPSDSLILEQDTR